MRSIFRYLVIVMAAVSAAVACSRPESMEKFILASEAQKVGGYIFDVDMADSLCTYDMDIYTRLDIRRSEVEELQDFPLTLTWTDPDGEHFPVTVYMDVTKMTDQSFFSKYLIMPFMENVSPKKHGVWQLKVSVPDVVSEMGMRGFGLIVKRNS